MNVSVQLESLPADEGTGAGKDPAKRRQILQGASTVFLNMGFSGASMGEIARAAGVSKGTLYAYFENKEALFVATIDENKRALFEHLFEFDEAAPVEHELERLGRGFASYISSPKVIATMRTVIGIAEQMPTLSCGFYERGPSSNIASFGSYLERKTQAGDLDCDDPWLAALQFLDLCQTGLVRPLLFGYPLEEGARAERVELVVRSAIRVFLKAYRPHATA